jgi:hypothetical protein
MINRIIVAIAKSDFPEASVQAILLCVGQASLQVANLDISLWVWI